MMQYLTDEQKQMARSLYQEAFPDDSDSFLAYYDENVLSRNLVLANCKDGKVISMIHQNPYQLLIRNQQYETAYLVAVATDKAYRRQGLMRKLMEQTIADLYEKGMPFCYLQPANPAYYTPFGFTYITRYQQLGKESNQNDCLIQTKAVGALSDKEKAEIEDWVRDHLARFYEIYCKRDAAYFERLWKELISENGAVTVYYQEGRIVALEADWGMSQREKRFVYALDDTNEKPDKSSGKPYMMARMLNMQACLEQIRLRESSQPLTITIEVSDCLIKDNNGCFHWEIDENGSRLERMGANQHIEQNKLLQLSIEELTAFVFGFDIPKGMEAYAKKIKRFDRILLDEVV